MGALLKTVLAAFAVVIAVVFFQFFSFRLLNLCELQKAPFIYGFDACETLFGQIVQSREVLDFYSALSSLFTSKIVISMSYNKTDVLLKSLTTKKNLAIFDEYTKGFMMKQIDGINNETVINEIASHLNSSEPKNIYVCPDFESSKEFVSLISRYRPPNVSDQQWYTSLWTLLHLNPEPIILSLLKPPDWPVPNYFGSCGRLAIVENCGSILTEFIDAPERQRINYSLQIIEAVLNFTFMHPSFGIYLTDISPDNFVVNSDGLIRFVDFENLILVNRELSELNDTSDDVIHVSDHLECQDCFAFSPQDICKSKISDHNIYGICKEIFSPSFIWTKGLLYDVHALDGSDLEELINLCITGKGASRFDTIKKIKRILGDKLNT